MDLHSDLHVSKVKVKLYRSYGPYGGGVGRGIALPFVDHDTRRG